MNKTIKNILFAGALTLGAFGVVTYTSCTKDACKGVVCNNGGTCVSGSCSCPSGYEGTNCQNKTRDKFIGSWAGSDVCGSGTYTITLNIGASSTSDINALISNPGGFGTNVTITGTVTGTNTITFSNASVGGGRTLSGTMTFNSTASTTTPTSMIFSYAVTPTTGAADNCTGNYTKQ